MLTNALQETRVLDFAQVGAGPCTAMLLGDMGAEVIKIESFGGDIGRKLGPPFQHGESTTSMALNRNKRSIAIDLKRREGVALVHRMAKTADVVVESFRPDVMDKLGVGFAALAQIQPRIVYCAISAYGQSGPWRDKPGVDGVLQAVSGLMSVVGLAGQAPCKVQIPAVDMTTGFLGALAIVSALHTRNREGKGGLLDVSMYNCALMFQSVGITNFLSSGGFPAKTGSVAPYSAPNEAIPTQDGWIMIAAYHEDRWKALCNLIGEPELINHPAFVDSPRRVANRDQMVAHLAKTFRTKSTAAWQALLEASDIIAASIAAYDTVVASPQAEHNNAIVTMRNAIAGEVRMPGFLLGDRDSRARVHRPPPVIGEHSKEILLSFGYNHDEADTLIATGVVKQWDGAGAQGEER
ncbi:MAG: CoA transferase [Betaproteobacteria bacterium]|nr:CoA transferase [Betaproteobacteria bacterium]